jgi:nitrogen fixation protein FixH
MTMPHAKTPPRRFTGRHMTAILVAFFAVVIAVNMLMATVAVRSFGGTVVDNSYVASQKFNTWLAEARAQQALGWRDSVTLNPTRHVSMTLNVRGAEMTAVAQHPLGRAADIVLRFHEAQPGVYLSDRTLPPGRWQVGFIVRHKAGEERLLREVR